MLHGFYPRHAGRARSRRRRRPHARVPAARGSPRRSRGRDLTDADQRGFTREESDALAAPLPPLSPRGLYWAATRASLRFGGLLSTGVKLGHATGFDSGSTLDYVYRNTPEGVTPVGRHDRPHVSRVDRVARHPPAQAPRRGTAARRDRRPAARAGAPVRIVDIAAGHGRYVLDAVAAPPAEPDCDPAARLRRDVNVAQGQALIRETRPRRHRDVRAGRRVRPREPRGDLAAPDDRHRVRTLRALPRQRAGARVAAGPRRRDRARRPTWSTPASRGIRSSS